MEREGNEAKLLERDEELPVDSEVEIPEEALVLPVPADEADLEFTVSELLAREELATGDEEVVPTFTEEEREVEEDRELDGIEDKPAEVVPGALVVPAGVEVGLVTAAEVDEVDVVGGSGFEVDGVVLVEPAEVGVVVLGVLDIDVVDAESDGILVVLVPEAVVALAARSEVLVVSCRFTSSICAMDII